MATAVATKSELQTVTVQITSEQKALLERAADMQGNTLEEFIIAVAAAKADEALYGRFDVAIRVSLEAYERLLEALDDPGEPSEHLRAAFARYDAMFGK